MKYFLIALCNLFFISAFAQKDIQIISPTEHEWNVFQEGTEKSIKFNLVNAYSADSIEFQITQGKELGMSIDSSGVFRWKPQYTLVDRIEKEKLIQILIEVRTNDDRNTSKTIDLIVNHTNRAPIVKDLPPFYIQFNTKNTYQIDPSLVYDEDFDPLVFIPSVEELPENLVINARGEVTWSPSYTQFKELQKEPLYIPFSVEDQPSKQQVTGRIKLVPTKLDLPPAITVVPVIEKKVILKENETINIGFYLSDPNGDMDIEAFDFLTNHPAIKKQDLIQNTPNQYEFIWTPGYDFVQDPADSLSFYIDFFVLDKSQQRTVKRIEFKVLNSINEAETDQKNFELYKGTMTRAWELMEQLKEKEEELKKSYNKAKKGKKHRSVVNASLGATTGLSSIFTRNKESLQRTISTLGGTTVLTIGTLEATEVIGKSMKDLIDRLNYVIEKKNEIQTKGDIFARDFSLKSARRSPEFKKNMDSIMAAMNLKGLVALELDATWENKKAPTDANIRKTFNDYSSE